MVDLHVSSVESVSPGSIVTPDDKTSVPMAEVCLGSVPDDIPPPYLKNVDDGR